MKTVVGIKGIINIEKKKKNLPLFDRGCPFGKTVDTNRKKRKKRILRFL